MPSSSVESVQILTYKRGVYLVYLIRVSQAVTIGEIVDQVELTVLCPCVLQFTAVKSVSERIRGCLNTSVTQSHA